MRRITCLALLATACTNTGELTVDLQTDFVPGVEFDHIALEIDQEPVGSFEAHPSDEFGNPAHLWRSPAFPLGRHLLEAQLLSDGGIVNPPGALVVHSHGDELGVVTIYRSCASVMCSPTQHCVGDECIENDCDQGGADAGCVAHQCDDTRPCVPIGPCIVAVCEIGGCLQIAHDDLCDSDQQCVAQTGDCQFLPGEEPPDPPIITGADVTITAITPTWTMVDRAVSYEIQCSLDMDFPMDPRTDSTTTPAAIVTASFGSRMAATPYWLRVRGVNARGRQGDWSDELMVTTGAPPPVAPDPPTGVALAAMYNASATRARTDPYWIYPPDGPTVHVMWATASGSCSGSTIEYRFYAQYVPTSIPLRGPTAWDTYPTAYFENATYPYGSQFTVEARCRSAAGLVSSTRRASACVDHGRGCP